MTSKYVCFFAPTTSNVNYFHWKHEKTFKIADCESVAYFCWKKVTKITLIVIVLKTIFLSFFLGIFEIQSYGTSIIRIFDIKSQKYLSLTARGDVRAVVSTSTYFVWYQKWQKSKGKKLVLIQKPSYLYHYTKLDHITKYLVTFEMLFPIHLHFLPVTLPVTSAIGLFQLIKIYTLIEKSWIENQNKALNQLEIFAMSKSCVVGIIFSFFLLL